MIAPVPDHGLGRRPDPDPRDHRYLLNRLTARAEPVVRKNKYWPIFTKPFDQGSLGICVGSAWKHWMLSAPTIQTRLDREPLPHTIYDEATRLDEWPENDNDTERQFGTSVRAGAKSLQARGYITEYNWAFDVDTIVDYLCAPWGGPVVLGTDWTMDMFYPNSEGIIRWNGQLVGGHAYLAIGVNVKRGLIRILNSWGSGWGQGGRAWLPMDDLLYLIRHDGEACCGFEQRIPIQ